MRELGFSHNLLIALNFPFEEYLECIKEIEFNSHIFGQGFQKMSVVRIVSCTLCPFYDFTRQQDPINRLS